MLHRKVELQHLNEGGFVMSVAQEVFSRRVDCCAPVEVVVRAYTVPEFFVNLRIKFGKICSTNNSLNDYFIS